MSNDSIMTSVTDEAFESVVLQSKQPVLVDFWAQWCGPCNMIAPVLEELAKEYAGKLDFVKVDVDQNRETPTKYSVRGIPTLMIFKNGEAAATMSGASSKDQLVEFIERALAE